MYAFFFLSLFRFFLCACAMSDCENVCLFFLLNFFQKILQYFVAVVVHFLIPTFVVDDEAFGYSCLDSGWCWISSNACIVVCDNVFMCIHTCLSLLQLHSHLLV